MRYKNVLVLADNLQDVISCGGAFERSIGDSNIKNRVLSGCTQGHLTGLILNDNTQIAFKSVKAEAKRFNNLNPDLIIDMTRNRMHVTMEGFVASKKRHGIAYMKGF